jgi:hypothetical protein
VLPVAYRLAPVDIAAESRTLQRLRLDPDSLIDELGIDRDQLDRLKDVRTSVVMRGRSITFETGTTIEASPAGTKRCQTGWSR